MAARSMAAAVCLALVVHAEIDHASVAQCALDSSLVPACAFSSLVHSALALPSRLCALVVEALDGEINDGLLPNRRQVDASSFFIAATGSLSSPTAKWNRHGVEPTLPGMPHRHMSTLGGDALAAADESESPAGHCQGAAEEEEDEEDEDDGASDSAGDTGVGLLISSTVSASNVALVSSLTSLFISRMQSSRVGSASISTHLSVWAVGVL